MNMVALTPTWSDSEIFPDGGVFSKNVLNTSGLKQLPVLTKHFKEEPVKKYYPESLIIPKFLVIDLIRGHNCNVT